MGKGKSRAAERGAAPQLVFRETPVPCGYAPRTLLLSETHDALFVGCKDGSVTVVTRSEPEGAFHPTVLRSEEPKAAVRAVCEWGKGHLLVGRADGELELVRWPGPAEESSGVGDSVEIRPEELRSKIAGVVGEPAPDDPVLTLARLGKQEYLASFRKHGCWVFERGEDGRPHGGRPLELPQPCPGGVRFALPLARDRDAETAERWLLISERGDLLHWDGSSHGAKRMGDWPAGERPAAVNDVGLWRHDDTRRQGGPAQGVFLATDTGVYLVILREKGSNAVDPEGCRLSLPGLGTTCTALSYAEDDRHRFLWAADASGDCHLFWDEQRSSGQALNFRRSGLVHADSQVLVACAWFPISSKDRRAVIFGQARRNDRVVLSEYWHLQDVASKGEAAQGTSLEIRALLAGGSGAAVRRYLARKHAERHGSRIRPRPRGSWPRQALLADLFDHLAADDDERRILLESLQGQSSLADEILGTLAGKAESGTPASEERAAPSGSSRKAASAEVLELWTLSLLGAIHRASEPREAAYLALLRWLREREQQLDEESQDPGIVEVFEESVRFARKWGVYGEANFRRQDLTGPRERLRAQEEHREERLGAASGAQEGRSRIPERLDRLSYEVLLYQRQINLVHQVEGLFMRGRTAWDLATLDWSSEDGEKGRLVACSWIWGGIELFEVVRSDTGPGQRIEGRWSLRPPKEGSADGESRKAGGPVLEWEPFHPGRTHPSIRRSVAGHSRAIHLGRIGEAAYLLAAPTVDPGLDAHKAREEALFLWGVGTDEGRCTISERPKDEIPLGRTGESVYSLLEIDGGWLLVGLRGYEGRPRVRLLRVTGGADGLQARWEGEPLLLDPRASDGGRRGSTVQAEAGHSRSPDGMRTAEEAETNRVWSLACGPVSDGRCRVVVGCERGQIFRLRLKRGASGSWAVAGREEMVSRMGSAVLALAYHEGGTVTRLYAGCEDGTVAAWQELDAAPGEPPDAGRRRFASLWATWEGGAISGIHRIEGLRLAADPDEGAVVAVSREGRCVLFDDRATAGRPSGKRPGPSRIPFAGCRHGRPSLGSSCFASLPMGASSASLDLLVASGDGTLRLVTFHEPSFTDERDERYKDILRTWWRITEEGHQLRLASALYRAAPAMEGILVRWLLDPTYPEQEAPPPGWARLDRLPAWWLPRHLRRLLDLARAWRRFDAATDFGEVTRISEEAGYALELALRRAWQLDDLDLFQETCEVVLKRANFLVYETLRRKAELLRRGSGTRTGPERWAFEKRKVAELYGRLVLAIERPTNRWLATEDKEARARMRIVKHLVDGDTTWLLVFEAAHELEGRDAPGHEPCRQILQHRILAVSDLVFKRNPLVNLEALRAANLSLFRLCKRLSDEREGGWEPHPKAGPDPGELHWSVFEPYLRHLVLAAARTFGSHLELTDALAHEYGRTFALAVCACPSGTVRIANRMAETLLISDPDSEDDLSHRVERQLHLLTSLGLRYPDWVIPLFVAVARPAPASAEPLELINEALRGKEDPIPPRIEDDRRCLRALYGDDGVVGWFVDLERKLSGDARKIDLTTGGLEDLTDRCKALVDTDLEGLYEHSHRFWDDAVKKLTMVLGEVHVRRKSEEEIRPEVVLAIRRLAGWAKGRLEDLKQRYRSFDIFQPELRNFSEVLERLRRTAEDFPTSAAAQKNMIVGVLGHHLLEELDEHVLELIEIAQVMDPWMVWSHLDEGRPADFSKQPEDSNAPTAESFARYLVGRSRNAESIPKNLRTLQSLLAGGVFGAEKPGDPWAGIRNDLVGWRLPKKGMPPIDEKTMKESPFLRLVFDELDQNDRVYGPPVATRRENERPEVRCQPGPIPGDEESPKVRNRLVLRFRIREDICDSDGDDDALSRLRELADPERDGIERPFRPWRIRSLPSHGTGLYLANLAASVVGWRLTVREPEENPPTAIFHLEELDETPGAADRRPDGR